MHANQCAEISRADRLCSTVIVEWRNEIRDAHRWNILPTRATRRSFAKRSTRNVRKIFAFSKAEHNQEPLDDGTSIHLVESVDEARKLACSVFCLRQMDSTMSRCRATHRGDTSKGHQKASRYSRLLSRTTSSQVQLCCTFSTPYLPR